VNEAVDRVILQREAMDAGFAGSLGLSILAHLLIVGGAVAAPYLLPREPPLRVAEGFAVALPRGGGGAVEPPASAGPPTAPVDNPPAPPAEPPPKVLKPPKEEPRQTKGLPDLNAKKGKKPEKAPARTGEAKTVGAAPGVSPRTPGLEFGPPGPGVPTGTDTGGDWYLAAVQQKIWMIWNQQMKTGMTQPVRVSFTIQGDGTVTDIRVIQTSGALLLDLAAQRAIASASPFGPLPKDYGTDRITIEGVFKPTS
jgi:TonB family protein